MFKRFRNRESTAPLDAATARTRSGLLDRLAGVFGAVDITEDTWDELTTQLVRADVGAATAEVMVDDLRERASAANLRRASELPDILSQVMVRTLEKQGQTPLGQAKPAGEAVWSGAAGAGRAKPWVILMVGVNGSGKTTSIAKLARHHQRQGRKVLMVAADTFRAAAIEQLQAWGGRIGVPVMAGQSGGDPSAVVFDALQSQAGRQSDLILVDTAGRLHTQANLMAELMKVRSVIERVMPGAPHETLLVLDANTGQNGLLQASRFVRDVKVSGLILAKLDSSAKGGVAFAVTRELGLPIVYVGIGEGIDDLRAFYPKDFVAGILGE